MKVLYLISSHRSYEAPLLRLLESMARHGVPPDCVLPVVGGYEERFMITMGSAHQAPYVHLIRVEHNSYDHTAPIEAILDDDHTHVFLLHDTMEFTARTHELVMQGDPNADAVACWHGQCNLMLVKREWFLQIQPELQQFRNCSKETAVVSEGFIWKNARRPAHYPRNTFRYLQPDSQPFGGAVRQCEFYESIELIKWKANWKLPEKGREWEVRP